MDDERIPEMQDMTNAEDFQKLRKLMLTAVDIIDAGETGRAVWWEMVVRSLIDVAALIDRFCPSIRDRGFVFSMLNDALATIREHAHDADVRAQAACAESRHSEMDYHLCVEFWAQRLHDELARKFKLPTLCPDFPFMKQMAAAKKSAGDPDRKATPATDGTEA